MIKQIVYHQTFKKHFRKRISPSPKLEKQFRKRLHSFLHNPSYPLLKDHRLIGKKQSYRSFSVTGDVRVVYKIKDEILYLYDVGSHNQVY